jgi:hypothetical protein
MLQCGVVVALLMMRSYSIKTLVQFRMQAKHDECLLYELAH